MNWPLTLAIAYFWLWLFHALLFIRLFKTNKSANPWFYFPFAFVCAAAWPAFALLVVTHIYDVAWRDFFGMEEKP